MQLLKEFWENKPMMAEVQKHINQCLEEEAVKRVFAKEDVSGLGDAKKVVDNAFGMMDDLFTNEAKKGIVINEAR